MKEYYRINEIAKLYSISTDSLRYYEKLGILKPKREENGYRLYSLSDIYKITVIRDLRALDFSMEQIKDYLSHQSVEHTAQMLTEEMEQIKEKLRYLQNAELSIKKRIEKFKSLSMERCGEISLKELPERRCIQLSVEMTRDEEADFAIKKLHRRYESMLPALGEQEMGLVCREDTVEEAAAKNGYVTYSSVFFILEGDAEKYDFVLPAGKYLSVFYKGSYKETPKLILELQKLMKESGLEPETSFLELMHIDNRYTKFPHQWLTEIQIKVENKER